MDDHRLAIGRACAIAGCSRTPWYRPPADRSHRDQPVIEALLVLADTRDRWGFWKYATLLHAAHGWNPKRVYRVYCALKLNLPRRRKKRVLARPPWRWKPRRC